VSALVIAETATGTWHYHLREVKDGRLYLGGGAPPAVCGVALGWDTRLPLSAWGTRDHVPSRWCSECERRRPQVTEVHPDTTRGRR
jgi:hypothetical protein